MLETDSLLTLSCRTLKCVDGYSLVKLERPAMKRAKKDQGNTRSRDEYARRHGLPTKSEIEEEAAKIFSKIYPDGAPPPETHVTFICAKRPSLPNGILGGQARFRRSRIQLGQLVKNESGPIPAHHKYVKIRTIKDALAFVTEFGMPLGGDRLECSVASILNSASAMRENVSEVAWRMKRPSEISASMDKVSHDSLANPDYMHSLEFLSNLTPNLNLDVEFPRDENGKNPDFTKRRFHLVARTLEDLFKARFYYDYGLAFGQRKCPSCETWFTPNTDGRNWRAKYGTCGKRNCRDQEKNRLASEALALKQSKKSS